MERIQNFNFEVVYKKGEQIPHVDALSRHHEENIGNQITTEKRKRILQMHDQLIYRGAKAILEKFKEQGEIRFSEMKIKEAVKDCAMFKAYNPIRIQKYRQAEMLNPGERVAIEPKRRFYITTAIEYFTRKEFCK